MANVPPQPKIDQIVWFENHLDRWGATPTVFGITAAEATEITEATKAARDAYNEAQMARQDAKSATVTQDVQVQAMLGIGRNLVNVMKSHIEESGDPTLWGQAGLEPDAPLGTAPNPVAPYQLSAGLDSQGNVIVRWKVSQPRGVSGVIYSVRRNLDDGPFVLLDSVGGKEFTDETVPIGTRSVGYAIKAKRGTQMSAWSEALTVRFGRVGGGGAVFIASTSTAPAKLAA